MAATVQFWFEYASTYSFLSAMRIAETAAQRNVDVEWCPFLLGPIFAEQGWTTSPFNIYPAKGRYMWRDMQRICAARNLPLQKPDPFPQNSLIVARLAL
ncbi:MAG: DsbA family protein, partial [Pseudomonadota bacterium]